MATLHCQKCRTPLKIDSSLEDLNPASFKILADAAPILEPKAPEEPRSAAARQRKRLYDEVSKDAGPPMQKRTVSSTQRSVAKLDPNMSFVMLSKSQIAPGGEAEALAAAAAKQKSGAKGAEPVSVTNGNEHSYSQQMETVIRLFEILSARSDIDHPVCSECTELLLDGLQKRQASVIRERDAYVDFLKKAQEDVPTDEERAKTKRDLEDAQQREKVALRDLEALEAEKAKLENEIATLDAEAEQLDEEEERFWQERNAFTAELTSFQQERDSLQNQVTNDTKLLESLQRTNVYNDTFAIGHDGSFATINGMRLGKHSDKPADWPEINAAWGQVVLLLCVVAEKLGYKFKDYKLIPVGSTTKIIKYDPKQQSADGKPKGTVLELFSSGNISLGLGLFSGKFDEAMIAVLECIRQLGEHVYQTTAANPDVQTVKLPYEIHKDKISGQSIRYAPDQHWTDACKSTLAACKVLLAYASHLDGTQSAR